MTPRENFLAVINHEQPQWVPNGLTEYCMTGGFDEAFDTGPLKGGYDGYGVLYAITKATLKGTSPDPRYIVLEDVTKWKEIVKFPDLDAFDWQGMAAKQLKDFEYDQQIKDYWQFYGPFQRIANLLGFEEAIMQLMLEPKACYDLMEAVTDFRIKALPYIKKYINPDVYTLCDDVAHEKGTFMSVPMYEELIMPHHKRMLDAVQDYGMIPAIHCCGKCDTLIPSFLKTGAKMWNPAHSVNDIENILKNYGDKLVVLGGYNYNGRPGNEATPVEEIAAEVERCFNTYAQYGSYAFQGSILGIHPDIFMEKMKVLIGTSVKMTKTTPVVYRPSK